VKKLGDFQRAYRSAYRRLAGTDDAVVQARATAVATNSKDTAQRLKPGSKIAEIRKSKELNIIKNDTEHQKKIQNLLSQRIKRYNAAELRLRETAKTRRDFPKLTEPPAPAKTAEELGDPLEFLLPPEEELLRIPKKKLEKQQRERLLRIRKFVDAVLNLMREDVNYATGPTSTVLDGDHNSSSLDGLCAFLHKAVSGLLQRGGQSRRVNDGKLKTFVAPGEHIAWFFAKSGISPTKNSSGEEEEESSEEKDVEKSISSPMSGKKKAFGTNAKSSSIPEKKAGGVYLKPGAGEPTSFANMLEVINGGFVKELKDKSFFGVQERLVFESLEQEVREARRRGEELRKTQNKLDEARKKAKRDAEKAVKEKTLAEKAARAAEEKAAKEKAQKAAEEALKKEAEEQERAQKAAEEEARKAADLEDLLSPTPKKTSKSAKKKATKKSTAKAKDVEAPTITVEEVRDTVAEFAEGVAEDNAGAPLPQKGSEEVVQKKKKDLTISGSSFTGFDRSTSAESASSHHTLSSQKSTTEESQEDAAVTCEDVPEFASQWDAVGPKGKKQKGGKKQKKKPVVDAAKESANEDAGENYEQDEGSILAASCGREETASAERQQQQLETAQSERDDLESVERAVESALSRAKSKPQQLPRRVATTTFSDSSAAAHPSATSPGQSSPAAATSSITPPPGLFTPPPGIFTGEPVVLDRETPIWRQQLESLGILSQRKKHGALAPPPGLMTEEGLPVLPTPPPGLPQSSYSAIKAVRRTLVKDQHEKGENNDQGFKNALSKLWERLHTNADDEEKTLQKAEKESSLYAEKETTKEFLARVHGRTMNDIVHERTMDDIISFQALGEDEQSHGSSSS